MDVTFVLEESGVTATVEVPCEADVAAAKEVACTALAVSPASVEMRIGTQVLEGTCRLQDTAFDAGVQVVLSRRFADIKCPAEYPAIQKGGLLLSSCGTLCVHSCEVYSRKLRAFNTESFRAVDFKSDGADTVHQHAISQCKTRCYLACYHYLLEVAFPGGEVLRKVDGSSRSVFACGGVVVSQGEDSVSVYDEDLALLRFLSHERCMGVAVSDCGGWVITSSETEKKARLWDVNTGVAVACVPAGREGWEYGVALSRSASVFAVVEGSTVHLYDWSGAALRSVDIDHVVQRIQFTPCGKYFVVGMTTGNNYPDDPTTEPVPGVEIWYCELRQYDVVTMSCVRVFTDVSSLSFAISPCSRVVVLVPYSGNQIATRHLYPHNE